MKLDYYLCYRSIIEGITTSTRYSCNVSLVTPFSDDNKHIGLRLISSQQSVSQSVSTIQSMTLTYDLASFTALQGLGSVQDLTQL
jgi:hypothetical protein